MILLKQNNKIPVIRGKFGSFKGKPLFPRLEPAEIQYRIDQYNKLQTVLNEDMYGRLKNDSLVIVVMVCIHFYDRKFITLFLAHIIFKIFGYFCKKEMIHKSYCLTNFKSCLKLRKIPQI